MPDFVVQATFNTPYSQWDGSLERNLYDHEASGTPIPCHILEAHEINRRIAQRTVPAPPWRTQTTFWTDDEGTQNKEWLDNPIDNSVAEFWYDSHFSTLLNTSTAVTGSHPFTAPLGDEVSHITGAHNRTDYTARIWGDFDDVLNKLPGEHDINCAGFGYLDEALGIAESQIAGPSRSLLAADVTHVPRASTWVVPQASYRSSDDDKENEVAISRPSSWETYPTVETSLPRPHRLIFDERNEASPSRITHAPHMLLHMPLPPIIAEPVAVPPFPRTLEPSVPSSLIVHTPNAFLCRWEGSIGCTHVVEDTHSNLMLIEHLEAFHGFNGRQTRKDGKPDRRGRTAGKGPCRWEGCKREHDLENYGGLLKHVRTGGHKRSMVL